MNIINELRLGNIVLIDNIITVINIDFFKNYNKKIKIKGIKLSEDLILSALNFYKQENERGESPYYFSQIDMGAYYSFSGLYMERKKFWILGGSYPQIKYLHQLQNVYYWCVGEDIIINLKKIK